MNVLRGEKKALKSTVQVFGVCGLMSDVLQGFFMCRKLHSWKHAQLRWPKKMSAVYAALTAASCFIPQSYGYFNLIDPKVLINSL